VNLQPELFAEDAGLSPRSINVALGGPSPDYVWVRRRRLSCVSKAEFRASEANQASERADDGSGAKGGGRCVS
jgi:hypothetical protein